jgi:polysaccharide export outer membrane protein
MWHLLFTLVVVAGLHAPAGQGSQPAGGTAGPAYAVGPNDTLAVKVFDEPALSGAFRVDADGSITYPLIGRVDVGGKTVREVEEHLTKLLGDGFLRRPQVSVEIAEYRSRSIFVIGEVRSPGKYAIEGEVTLLEVLANAGSVTPTAGNEVLVRRMTDGRAGANPALPQAEGSVEVLKVDLEDLRTGRAGLSLLLQDGDTIIVQPAPRFYISGFVRNPGNYVLQPRMTVQQAIAVAGGLTERGSDRGIKIQRTENGKTVERDAQLTDFVQPDDTIRIRQRRL